VNPQLRRYALALWALLALFVLRVAGQLLSAAGFGDFLPPWEEWFSGLVPYAQLLGSQPSGRPAAAEGTRVEIMLWPTSHVFRQGHRIRLEISGSNFPRFDRHSQTSDPIATAIAPAIATHAVHHSAPTPSRIVLPMVPRAR
jgi:hypothetical protein